MLTRFRGGWWRGAAGAALAAATFFAAGVASAAPINASWFCSAYAQSTRTEYVTGIFSADLNNPDVASAWNRYLEGQHIDVGTTGGCQRAVSADGVKQLRDIARDTPNNIGAKLVDVDWKFAPGQVAASDPGKLYYYCQSGTSVAGVTYFSDVFGLPAIAASGYQSLPITPFFQFVQKQYNSPPGLAVGPPTGPNGRWCEFVGNITETERSKKAWQDKLRAQGRQIVETGWKYGDATSTGSAVSAAPTAPPAAPAPQQAASAAPAAAQTASIAPANDDSTYFCMATSWPAKVVYFTRRYPLDADQRDVMDAWAKWQSLDHTPGVVENGGATPCYFRFTATEQQYQQYRRQAEGYRHADPAWRIVDVDWRYTPNQLAMQSKPGAQYGFCWAQAPDQKTMYLSAAFEMPLEYVSESKHVMSSEFGKALTATKGLPARPYEDARVAACVPQGSATAAETNRQKFGADARQRGLQIVETGWAFVRTAQTPSPGQQPGGH